MKSHGPVRAGLVTGNTEQLPKFQLKQWLSGEENKAHVVFVHTERCSIYLITLCTYARNYELMSWAAVTGHAQRVTYVTHIRHSHNVSSTYRARVPPTLTLPLWYTRPV
jgi:hypothetical protein